MENIRNFIENVNLDTRLHDEHELLSNKQFFRKHCVEGFDRLMDLKDKHEGQSALIMGLGPSLLELDKEKYSSFLKLTCNHFHRVPDFFNDDFKPDFWCAANSLEALTPPISVCLEKNINCFITIPKKTEFEKLLLSSANKMDLVFPWIWEHRVFQHMIAAKYGLGKTYSHCNTVTNHMIAFALWLGCSDITVTGFDMSYKRALETTGKTNAGFNKDWIENDDSKSGNNAFSDPIERRQILSDLKYLCTIANFNSVRIKNLSHKANQLPEIIA